MTPTTRNEFQTVVNQIDSGKRLSVLKAVYCYNCIAADPLIPGKFRKHVRRARRKLVSQSIRRAKKQEMQSDEI